MAPPPPHTPTHTYIHIKHSKYLYQIIHQISVNTNLNDIIINIILNISNCYAINVITKITLVPRVFFVVAKIGQR